MNRTPTILFWFSLIIITSIGLYRTSNRVQELNQQLHNINAAIDAEKQSLHVLKAEWVYLANPARIETASRRHLALRPSTPKQVATMDTLSEVLPTRTEAMQSVAVNATPMANVKTTLASLPPSTPTITVDHANKHLTKPVTVASVDSGHLRDHMVIQRTASAEPLPGDSIGALIGRLNSGR